MPENIILPTNDLAFKKLFANNNYQGIPKGLIQDFYDIAIQDVYIENPYSIDEFNSVIDKGGYFVVEVDSFCTAENGWKFSMEMQLYGQLFYPERSLKYLFDKYNSTYGVSRLMRSRSKYSSLYPTFSINVLGYNYFQSDKKAIRKFTLYDKENDNHFHTPDLVTLGFFELQKPDLSGRKNLMHWRDLFLSGKASHGAPKYIQEAASLLKTVNFSKEERKMIDLLERAREDRIAQEEYVFDKGRLEGRLEGELKGELKGKLGTAISVIKELNLSVTKAMQITGLEDTYRDELISQLEEHNITYAL